MIDYTVTSDCEKCMHYPICSVKDRFDQFIKSVNSNSLNKIVFVNTSNFDNYDTSFLVLQIGCKYHLGVKNNTITADIKVLKDNDATDHLSTCVCKDEDAIK